MGFLFLYDCIVCVGECIFCLSFNILFWIIIGNFSFTERLVVKYVGVMVMYFVLKKLKKKYNIIDECVVFYDVVEIWVDVLNGCLFFGIFNFIM